MHIDTWSCPDVGVVRYLLSLWVCSLFVHSDSKCARYLGVKDTSSSNSEPHWAEDS